jgi:hypothetical protein
VLSEDGPGMCWHGVMTTAACTLLRRLLIAEQMLRQCLQVGCCSTSGRATSSGPAYLCEEAHGYALDAVVLQGHHHPSCSTHSGPSGRSQWWGRGCMRCSCKRHLRVECATLLLLLLLPLGTRRVTSTAGQVCSTAMRSPLSHGLCWGRTWCSCRLPMQVHHGWQGGPMDVCVHQSHLPAHLHRQRYC